MMPRTRHGHQFQHGFLLCLPLLTLLSLSLPLGPVGAAEENEGTAVTWDLTFSYLSRTLQALENLMGFFHAQYTQVNLDGVIGMRMVQATLKVLLQNLEEREQKALLPQDLVVDLQSLHDMSERVANLTEPQVAKNERRYYRHQWPLINNAMWELNYPTRNLSTNVTTWAYDELEHMREHMSDNCVAEFFGTGKTRETCAVSDKCWNFMTQMGYHRYSLTHQIFYLQLGELSGCMPDMLLQIQNNGSRPPLVVLQDTFCFNILLEAKRLVNLSYPMNSRDLFMEQAGLCGMYGYWEFFHYSWLDAILSWQDKENGCYKNKNWPEYLKDKKRPKREELRVGNDCLSHKSSVASMALGQYVRYLTEALLPPKTTGRPIVDQLYW